MSGQSMADVLNKHGKCRRLSRGNYAAKTYTEFYACLCGKELPSNSRQSMSAHQAAALSAAGFGPVQEAKAEALEDAADDPMLRLPGHIARLRARAAALRGQG